MKRFFIAIFLIFMASAIFAQSGSPLDAKASLQTVQKQTINSSQIKVIGDKANAVELVKGNYTLRSKELQLVMTIDFIKKANFTYLSGTINFYDEDQFQIPFELSSTLSLSSKTNDFEALKNLPIGEKFTLRFERDFSTGLNTPKTIQQIMDSKIDTVILRLD